METEVPPGKSVLSPVIRRSASRRTLPYCSFPCAVGFTSLPSIAQMSGMGLRSAVRMVAAFYVVVGQPAIEGEVTKMTIEPLATSDGPRLQAVVIVRNWGHKYFRPSGDLAILNDAGAVLETEPFPSIPVLPEREQCFRFQLKAELAQQKYTLRARVDLGQAEVQETTASVVPPVLGR